VVGYQKINDKSPKKERSMKPNLTLPSLVLGVILTSLLALSGCSDSNNIAAAGGAAIVPGINPAFDTITEVAVSPDPGGPYNDVLVEDTDYTYDPGTESITSTSDVDPGGVYVRITGLATVTGTQSSYTVYTYISSNGIQVAANELTSYAVGLVASGAAANFEEALGLVETEFGLPAGSVADPVVASLRPAALTSVMSAATPGFVDGAFDVSGFDQAALDASPAAYLACIEQGGLAWDSWHKTDAGGSGLPTDESDNDYTRCKACHGWDQQGTDGGYVRRSRNAGRANAGYQDPNNCDLPMSDPLTCTPSRNISTDATFGRGSAIEIPAGGRTWAEGSTVFDMVDPDWGAGAILGNRHPDLSAAEGPTAVQLSCLTAFLNAPEARADQVYAAMETMPADGKPAIYTPVATADAAAGATYYGANCMGCHGDPSDDSTASTDDKPGTGGIIGYLNSDGKFSEFMHKMHWGIPNTSMSRASMGNPRVADVANVVARMQAIPFEELSAAQVVPAVAGITARGSGSYTLTAAGLEYNITVDTASLSGPITFAHLHLGRVGTNGDLLHVLDPSLLGVWADPSPAERTALLAGNVYVNIHTDANPGGEIRGQVKVAQGTGNQSPTACFDVAPSVNVEPATPIMLDANCSTDTDGPSPLTYSWTLGVPGGSATALSSTDMATSSFTPDVEGDYHISLAVSDGLADDTAVDTVTAAAALPDPTASELAGRDQYDAECAGCHGATEWDINIGFAGNLTGGAQPVIADLTVYDGSMGGVSPLSAQEVIDLNAFLNGICVQVPTQCQP
jgi:mono/diheme cytochrome c family protein